MEVGAEEHLQPHSPQQHPRDRGCVREVGAKGLGFRLCRSTEMPLGVDFSPQHQALVRVLVLFSFIQMFIVFSGLLPTHTNRSCDFLLHGFTSDENKRKGRGKKEGSESPLPPSCLRVPQLHIIHAEHWTVLLNIMTWRKSHCALTYQQRSKAITELNTVEEDPIKRNPRKFGENS